MCRSIERDYASRTRPFMRTSEASNRPVQAVSSLSELHPLEPCHMAYPYPCYLPKSNEYAFLVYAYAGHNICHLFRSIRTPRTASLHSVAQISMPTSMPSQSNAVLSSFRNLIVESMRSAPTSMTTVAKYLSLVIKEPKVDTVSLSFQLSFLQMRIISGLIRLVEYSSRSISRPCVATCSTCTPRNNLT